MIRFVSATWAALLTASSANAEVPLSYAPSGHPMVPVLVNGTGPFEFVIDTGAEGTALYSWFSSAQGLLPTEDSRIEVQGQTGASSVPMARLAALELDSRLAADIEAVILPDRSDGVPLSGIVGLDLLGSYVVEFDFAASVVRLHPSGTAAETLGRGLLHRIPAESLRGGLLGLPVIINGAAGIAVLDTGARDTRINWQFARAAGLTPDSPGLIEDGVIHGATNTPVIAHRGVVGDVELGGSVRHGVSARIVDLPVFDAFGVADRPAMILGMDLLAQSRLVVDFPNRTVWFSADGRR